jgi:hypothetical protein
MVTAKQCGSNEISITDAGIKSIKVELLEHHLRFLAHCFNVELLIQADDSEQGNHLLQIFRQKGYVPLNPSRRCERIAVLNVVSMHLLDLACYKPSSSPRERCVLKNVCQPVGSTNLAASEKQRSGDVSGTILNNVRAEAVAEDHGPGSSACVGGG